MKKLMLLLSLLLLAGHAWALPYTGTLTQSSGLIATGAWASSSSFSWEVNYDGGNDLWTYDYTWSGLRKALSHIIVQVSDTFEVANIFEGTTEDDYELGSFDGPSNPGIPSALYGLKFETTDDPLIYSFTIVTDRAPMWGNFYAKDGTDGGVDVYAYNTGFSQLAPEFDGLVVDPIFNIDGTMYGWALVPDTESGGGGGGGGGIPAVPEPGTFILVGAGLVGLALLRRKQGR